MSARVALLMLVAFAAAAALALRRTVAPAEGAGDAAASEYPAFDPPVAAAMPAVDILQTWTAAVTGTLKKLFQLPAAAAPYADAIRAAEVKNSLPSGLLGRVLHQESRYRPEIISGQKASSAGAIGIAQFMPGTARDLGVDPRDPFQSIDGAARYLRQLYGRFGSWDQALAAYNWGQGNQGKDLRDGIVGNEWPTETRNYVQEILADVPA